ncbi:helix-turn-helix transcriptional regulator [Pleomorphovibrio marinus]|uniref:helix-turn-helix transcriptional regulator n=1 Tax=Pleomorphovibrio marinus TaxID=2164132 RepID=UPI000E0BA190|nr:YafY family protein [Pleomorphovibrio marinus]
MNRLTRLTSILTHLQTKRKITAQELASKYKVSLRTIYRDMRTLEEAGVPLMGEAGMGYALVEGYRLPPVMFTQEEALSLLLAEKLFGKVSDHESSRQFESAMEKIKAVLKTPEKEALEELSSFVTVNRHNSLSGKDKGEYIPCILKSLHEHKLLEMVYTSFEKEETTHRQVEPVGIYFAHEHWYLIAFCKLRKDYRNFRISRIKQLRVLDEPFTTGHPSLEQYLESVKEKEKLLKIVIAIPKKFQKYISEEKYNHGFVMEEEKGDEIWLTFMSSSLEGFVRWVVMMGDIVEVISPESLKSRLNQLLKEMLAKQGNFNATPTYN